MSTLNIDTESQEMMESIFSLFQSEDDSLINQGLILLETLHEPKLWSFLSKGIRIEASRLTIGEGPIKNRTNPLFYSKIALHVAHYSNLLCEETSLLIEEDWIEDLSLLTKAKKLEHLHLYNCTNLRNLGGIEHLTSLITLSLRSCNALEDINPLQEGKKLSSLTVEFCPTIHTLAPISLHRLELSFVDHFDLSILSPLRDLTEIQIGNSPKIKDISLLKQHPLTMITIFDEIKERQLATLGEIATLKRLHIDMKNKTKIINLEALYHHPNLRELVISGGEKVVDISPLSHMHKIKTIQLINFTQLSSLDAISHMSQLETISLSNCDGLWNLLPLWNLKKLNFFSISYHGLWKKYQNETLVNKRINKGNILFLTIRLLIIKIVHFFQRKEKDIL